MQNRRRLMPGTLFVSFMVTFICLTGLAHAAIESDFLMDTDPAFHVPDRVEKFDPGYLRLWMTALDRPEIDMQRMAAESIARAHKIGFSDLIEAVPLLEKILLAHSSHPAARFAAARALIVIESHGSAAKLLKASQDFGADLRQLVEPALAKWDFAPARSLWIDRLETPKTQHRDLLLAIRGLGQVREISALPTLLKITSDLVRGTDIRLEAAAAAGQLTETGLESDAARLSQETRTPPLVNRLCSIRLLARHRGAEAIQLLVALAGEAEPAVSAAALGRLNEIDSALVLPFAVNALSHADQHVREQAIIAFLNLPTIERITLLGPVLNDGHPLVRQRVSDGLLLLSKEPSFQEAILASATEILAGDRWQGQEQAALLLGALKHEPAATRLVELLESSQRGVSVASAWAVRKIAVRETIPAIIDRARRVTADSQYFNQPGIDEHVAHLYEACGVMRATDAVTLMIKYIPYASGMGERSRSAAIWALGWISEGTPNQALSKALIQRVDDDESTPPESALVKQLCVVSLARTKAVDQAPAIRIHVAQGVPPSKVGLAMRWAIKELTNEELPEPIPQPVDPGSWFLEPLKSK